MNRRPAARRVGEAGRRAALLALLSICAACGSRGNPLPPMRPLPPPLLDVRVAQRGTDAVLRFAAPPPVVNVEGAEVPLDRIELLVLAERYPLITAPVLASSLERERRDRLQAAREAAERAERTLARQRGEEPEEATEEAAAEQERKLSPEEELLRSIPNDVRTAWRADDEVRAPVILESARRLEHAVDLLWLELGLPTAIIDQRRPPELPDPVRVIAAAERVSRGLSYEGDKEIDVFLEGAAVVATIPIADIDEYRVGDSLQVVHGVGAPAQSDVRTRYFFAVRTVSERGRPGEIQKLAALAPAAVPTAPEAITASVGEPGVLLSWQAPAADVAGSLLAPEAIRYNVYRKVAADGSFPDRPLNAEPLELTELLDFEVEWGETYVYEVRALNAPPGEEEQEEEVAAPSPAGEETPQVATGPIKESFGRQSAEVEVLDTFPPPAVTGLQAVRAARTVTLRWEGVAVSDLAGYRVYRHPAPAPEIPGLPPAPVPVMEPAVEQEAAAEAGQSQEAGQAAAEVVAEEAVQEEAEQQAEQEAEQGPSRRRRRNQLVAAGWELLTAVPVTEPRFIDPSADPSVEWVYVVEAVDESGNAGPPAMVTVAAREEEGLQ